MNEEPIYVYLDNDIEKSVVIMEDNRFHQENIYLTYFCKCVSFFLILILISPILVIYLFTKYY